MKVVIESFLKDLTPEYLEDKKNELPEVKNLINTNDFKEIQKKFHKLAGSGGGYGLNEVSNIARKIEHLAMEEKAEEIKVEFEKYQEFLLTVELVF